MDDISRKADVRHAYLHVPFCLRKCTYCAFVSEASMNDDRVGAYVEALMNQIKLQSFMGDPVSVPLQTVYIGGGTPTCLTTEDLVRILDLIRVRYGIAADAEVTIEMNPGTLSRQDLKALRVAGYNRLSIGVQSLNDDLLKVLGRMHTSEAVWETLAQAREAGFTNYNVDLMLGLPGQTVDDVKEAIRAVVTAGATHMSFYSLILEDDTPMARGVEKGLVDLPDEVEEREQYHAAFELLKELGLPPYEISCAAKPGFHSKHNISYWEGRSYYGWGTSASSFVGRVRRTMTRSTDEYIGLMSQAHASSAAWLGAEDESFIDDEEAMREYLIFGLRRLAGVSDSEAESLLGRPIADRFRVILDQHVENGLLRKPDNQSWAYTKLGLDLADTVARDLI